MSTVIPFDMYLPLYFLWSLFLNLSLWPLSKYPPTLMYLNYLLKKSYNNFQRGLITIHYNVLKEEYLENKHIIIFLIWKFLKVQMQIT